MQFLTPELFDVLIIVVIIIALIAAGFRLRADLTREIPPEIKWDTFNPDDDTKPNEPHTQQ
jgi:hypothetical protein